MRSIFRSLKYTDTWANIGPTDGAMLTLTNVANKRTQPREMKSIMAL